MKWRFFEPNDLNWILRTTRDMFNESEWKDELEYNTEKVTNYFFSALSNAPSLFLNVISFEMYFGISSA